MISLPHILGLDDSHLVDCQQGHRLQLEVANAFQMMQLAAQEDGVDCQIVSSYRSFEQQKNIWEKKWLGQKELLDINEQILPFSQLNDEQKLDAILTWSALPGASRHHWGSDLDVYDRQKVTKSNHTFQLVQHEYLATTGPCNQLNIWLDTHAKDFGFFRPFARYTGGVAAEPWHLSYRAVSDVMSEKFKLEALEKALIHAQLAGLASILPNLNVIYSRFILNQGKT